MLKNKRKDALLSGDTHYFNGKPCPKGHTAERRAINGACKTYYKDYVAQNKNKIRKISSRWQKNNKGKANAVTAKRHAAKMQRTPPWLSKQQLNEIKDFYVMAAELETIFPWKQWVDHIVPMQGKTVSGLHVPWNLQILPSRENISKGNRFSG